MNMFFKVIAIKARPEKNLDDRLLDACKIAIDLYLALSSRYLAYGAESTSGPSNNQLESTIKRKLKKLEPMLQHIVQQDSPLKATLLLTQGLTLEDKAIFDKDTVTRMGQNVFAVITALRQREMGILQVESDRLVPTDQTYTAKYVSGQEPYWKLEFSPDKQLSPFQKQLVRGFDTLVMMKSHVEKIHSSVAQDLGSDLQVIHAHIKEAISTLSPAVFDKLLEELKGSQHPAKKFAKEMIRVAYELTKQNRAQRARDFLQEAKIFIGVREQGLIRIDTWMRILIAYLNQRSR